MMHQYHRPHYPQHHTQSMKHETSNDRHSVGQISENMEYDNDRKYSISGEHEEIFFISFNLQGVGALSYIYICIHILFFHFRRKLLSFYVICLTCIFIDTLKRNFSLFPSFLLFSKQITIFKFTYSHDNYQTFSYSNSICCTYLPQIIFSCNLRDIKK